MTGDRGQALVELALVLPVLLTLAFAVVVLSDVAVARLTLEHAAAEGARVGALTNDDELIRETVRAAAARDTAELRIDIEPRVDEPPRTGDPRGSLLQVRVRATVRPLPLAFVSPFEVHATATRRVEWTP